MTTFLATGAAGTTTGNFLVVPTAYRFSSPTTSAGVWIQSSPDYSFCQALATEGTAFILNPGPQTFIVQRFPPMPEPEAQQRLQQAQILRDRRRRQSESERAELKAQQLLFQQLNMKQRLNWSKRGFFDVKVRDKMYRINRGRVGNVEQIDNDGNVLIRLCCHTVSLDIPDSDNAMAQLLMLRFREQEFLSMANVHYRNPRFERLAA
jgi:hypothetical protein